MKPSLGDDVSRAEIIRCLNEWLNAVLLRGKKIHWMKLGDEYVSTLHYQLDLCDNEELNWLGCMDYTQMELGSNLRCLVFCFPDSVWLVWLKFMIECIWNQQGNSDNRTALKMMKHFLCVEKNFFHPCKVTNVFCVGCESPLVPSPIFISST